jgi:hypothetical protein
LKVEVTLYNIEGLPDWKLAYIAGIVDGEGSIYLTLRKRDKLAKPCFVVGMTDPVCINALHNATGLGNVNSSTNQTHGFKCLYTWKVGSRLELYLLLRAIQPYLITKVEQAKVMVEFLERRISGRVQGQYDDELRVKLCNLNK